MDIPVYLFTGFLEAGKTKFIKETMQDENFNDLKRKYLIIQCEEGEEEIEPGAVMTKKSRHRKIDIRSYRKLIANVLCKILVIRLVHIHFKGIVDGMIAFEYRNLVLRLNLEHIEYLGIKILHISLEN